MKGKRISWSFGVFIITFVVVYFVVSGKIFAYTNHSEGEVIAEVVDNMDFGISRAYQTQYHVDVQNTVDLKIDIDRDGLRLMDEYTYNTDPHNADTDKDGYTDGQEITNGYSPVGSGKIDANKNALPDTWENELAGGLISDVHEDIDMDGLSYEDEYLFGTDPKIADSDHDGFFDGREIQNGYDPVAPGDARIAVTISIDKISVTAPVVLSKNEDEKTLLSDLTYGVVHYPDTPMPGQRGNTYIAGHSSNYAWSEGAYNYIFKNLNDLAIGDVITIKLLLHNKKEVIYRYAVTSNEIVLPDDERIFAQTQQKELTLTTCWPIGSNTKRVMIKAEFQDA